MKKINLTNTFTVSCGDRVAKAHNRMLDFIPLLSGSAYGKYLAVGKGEGMINQRINALAVKETEVSAYNTDRSRGEVFAVFVVRFTDEQLAPGTKVSEAGLCASLDGALADYASFEPVEKKDGIDLIVKAEIHAYLDGNISFTAGENDFAALLLGMRGGENARYSMGLGDNYHPTACIKKRESAVEISPAEVSTASTSLTFSAEFSSAPYEVILYLDQKPVLRSYHLAGASAKLITLTLDSSRCIEVEQEHLLYISNLRSYGEPVLSFSESVTAKRVTADCLPVIEQVFPSGARFLHEPTGTYIAVLQDKEVAVYEFSDGVASPKYKIDAISETPILLCDGSLLLSGGELCFVNAEGKKVNLAVNAESAVGVGGSGDYFIAVKNGNNVTFYGFDGETITQNESVEVGNDCLISRINEHFIALLSHEKSVYRAVSKNGRFAKVETLLTLSAQNFTVRGMEDCWLKLADGDKEFIVNMLGDELIENDGRLVCEEYYFTCDGSLTTALCSTLGESRTPVAFPISIPVPDDFAFLGGYIVTLLGGKITTLYPVPSGRRIFCPHFSEGADISLTTLSAPSPVFGEKGVRVKLTLSQL